MPQLLIVLPSKELLPTDIQRIFKFQKIDVILAGIPIIRKYRWIIYWNVSKPLNTNDYPLINPNQIENVYEHLSAGIPTKIIGELNKILRSEKAQMLYLNTNVPVFYFTDGSCINNGKKDAKAGFGLVVFSAYKPRVLMSGKVLPGTYSFTNCLKVDKSNIINPSNNRGELLGLIFAFMSIKYEYIGRNVNICTDSKYCIDTFTKWYHSKKKKGIENTMKNIDMIEICMQLQQEIKIMGANITFTHVPSHRSAPASDSYIDKVIYFGNKDVDLLCKSAITERGLYKFEGSTSLYQYIE